VSFHGDLRSALCEGPAVQELTPEQLGQLERLDELLMQWSKRMDLIGFRSREDRIRRYFAEAIAAGGRLGSGRASGDALDVGSGGGSPALPLAIARPRWRWSLVESRRKKCIFLEEAVRALGLRAVRVVPERVESVEERAAIDAVTVRGVRMTPSLLARTATWLRPGGRVLWFSSEQRLAEGGRRLGLERLSLSAVEGPSRLLSGGSAFLLVLEKREEGGYADDPGVSRETL
jgi:16S rRNA (guanine527-N7)-methyltransferase